MSTQPGDVAIVGGGLLGLTLALRLADRGVAVTLYERAPHVGGLASSARFGDVTWDRFYHVMLQSDSALLAVLDRLGLREEVEWRATRTGLFDGEQLYSVSSMKDYALLPVLGLVSKARIAATMLRASSIRSGDALEKMTAKQWLTRWSGPRAYEQFWSPLLRAKLGDRHEDASAAFIWAILQRLYAARKAGMKQDLFGYVPGGYATILDRFEEAVRTAGVKLHLGADVVEVGASDNAGGAYVRTSDGITDHGGVVVTVPSPVASRLVRGLSESEIQAHTSIAYQGVVCVSLLLDRPLGGFYVTNITDSSVPFTGIIEMSALVDADQFGDRTLVYLPKYVPPDDPLFDRPDEAITEEFVEALGRVFGPVSDDLILASVVSRARYVLPVSTVGYSSRLPAMKTSVRGVSIVNTAHIVNGTLNANETIELVDRAMATIVGNDDESETS